MSALTAPRAGGQALGMPSRANTCMPWEPGRGPGFYEELLMDRAEAAPRRGVPGLGSSSGSLNNGHEGTEAA